MSLAQPVSSSPILPVSSSPLSSIQNAAAYTPSIEELTKLYNENFYWTLLKFNLMTAIQIGIVIWTLTGGGLVDIANNWPKYRCNPLIMPFASLFGADATENFNFCMKNIFTSNAGAVLAPLYGVMANFTDIVGTISNVANSFRYLIANLLHGMERLMGSFRDRFQFILFSIRMSFFKIMNLMGRLYSTFYAVIFMGMSALQAANNVANNDLVKFLLEFCFDPATIIELASGEKIPISALKIGDTLAMVDGVNPVVTSLFKFDGSKTPMVKVGNTIVSEQHYMKYKPLDSWIKAGENPDASSAVSLPLLVCLNTSTHTVLIDGDIFTDYDESENPDVIKQVQKVAESSLNSGRAGVTVDNYELGLDGSIPIKMKDGSFKEIQKISIGDILADGGLVKGLVKERVSSIVRLDNGYRVSASQLVWSQSSSAWTRAGTIYNAKPGVDIFYQIISDKSILESNGHMFRDYREVDIPEMEYAYSEKLKSVNNR
jgi:hypothetical protein